MTRDLREAEAERDNLARIVREGKEPRFVVCQERADYRAGQVYEVRTDTGELVTTRKMTQDERQLGLDAVLNLHRRTETDEETGEVLFRTEAEEAFEAGKRPNTDALDLVGERLRTVQVAVDAGDLKAAKFGLRQLVQENWEDQRVQLMVARCRDALGNLATEAPKPSTNQDEPGELPPEAGDGQDQDSPDPAQDRKAAAAGDDTHQDDE